MIDWLIELQQRVDYCEQKNDSKCYLMSLISCSFSLCQDEQKAAAMVGLSEEGPPKVDTEEVKHIGA